MDFKDDYECELFVDTSKAAVGKSVEPNSTSIEFSNGEPILLLKPNGDIFVKGKLVENDQEVVDGMRMLLGHPIPKPTKGLSFSKALELIKQGKKVKRAGWGGYWFMPSTDVVIVFEDKNWKTYNMNKMIVACLKDNGGYVPATPYQEDLLSEDWEVVE